MPQICQYTASGEAHGLVNTLTNANEFNDFKHMEPKIKAELQKQHKEDSQIKKVELICKGKNERLNKVYCRYAGDPIQVYNLIPGRTYELPMGLIKEVNEKRLPKRSGLMEVDGEKVTKDGSPLAQDQEGEWQYRLVPAGF